VAQAFLPVWLERRARFQPTDTNVRATAGPRTDFTFNYICTPMPREARTCGGRITPYSCSVMPRLRALLAILLAVTWCSAAWHVDLEAIGLLLEHSHHVHTEDDHGPLGAQVDHEQFFARNVTKDQFRLGGEAVLAFMLLALVPGASVASRSRAASVSFTRQRRENDPPLARSWQFAQRCAPDSVAPPAQG